MTRKKQVILLHILVWIQFFVLPFVFFPSPFHFGNFAELKEFVFGFILSNVLFIALFYLNFLYFVPRFYLKARYYQFAATQLSSLVLAILLALLLKHGAESQQVLIHGNTPPIFGSVLIRTVIVLLASFGLKIYIRWKKTEVEKTNAELSYLKAQINPHFLFNTLNGIYALAVKKSDDTAGAIVRLSSIMRYVITDAKEEYVSLEKEFKYISDYIDLQKMRLNKNVNVHFHQEGNPLGKKIVPMLYVSFIENAFKYGVSTKEVSTIEISQTIFRNELTVTVKNQILGKENIGEETSGIGMKNSLSRLQQFYINKHKLLIEQTEKEFFISLKIEL